MKPRYRSRLRLRGQAVFTNGSQTGEGLVLDLTSPGCLIESAGIAVCKGQSLQLNIMLKGHKRPLTVALGVVRWNKGDRFGVEFIKMDESNRLALNRYLAQHETVETKRNENSFTVPGGNNWHLQTYSMMNDRDAEPRRNGRSSS